MGGPLGALGGSDQYLDQAAASAEQRDQQAPLDRATGTSGPRSVGGGGQPVPRRGRASADTSQLGAQVPALVPGTAQQARAPVRDECSAGGGPGGGAKPPAGDDGGNQDVAGPEAGGGQRGPARAAGRLGRGALGVRGAEGRLGEGARGGRGGAARPAGSDEEARKRDEARGWLAKAQAELGLEQEHLTEEWRMRTELEGELKKEGERLAQERKSREQMQGELHAERERRLNALRLLAGTST